MKIRKALARHAEQDPGLAFAAALAGTVRERYRAAKARGADAGLSSMEYAWIAVGILALTIALVAAINTVFNRRIAIINGW